MNDLIPIDRREDGSLVVSSETIAGHTGVQHKNVVELIRSNIGDFEAFGGVAFETRPFETAGGTQHREVAQLNEHQATLLLTFMRNSPVVKAFKVSLVRAFYAMAQQLQAPRELSRADLARMVLEAEEEKAALAATVEAQRPAIEYHERYIADDDDIITVDNFASQYGSTGPKVRDLLRDRGIAVRRTVGKRWSESKKCMEEVYEWRARQGVTSADWFDLRPQHDAPRLHNGQVRQTLYVRQFYAQRLAAKLGLAQIEIPQEVA